MTTGKRQRNPIEDYLCPHCNQQKLRFRNWSKPLSAGHCKERYMCDACGRMTQSPIGKVEPKSETQADIRNSYHEIKDWFLLLHKDVTRRAWR